MSHEDKFYELMKNGEQTPTDEDVAPPDPVELYEEESLPKAPASKIHLARPVLEAIHDGREKLLDTIFNEKGKSDSAEQASMAQRFDHVRSGEFETSSPQLSAKSKMKIAEAPLTLAEQLRRLGI